MTNKKRGKKDKKIDYMSFNKGTLLLVIGLILFVFILIFKLIIGAIQIIIYAQLVSYLLIYLGLVFHFIFAGDKPFSESWDYLKESRNFIYLAVGLFLIFALIGFFIPAPDVVSEYIKNVIQQLIAETEGMSQSELIMFIFINNTRTSLFGIILGVFFGIFPLISTVGNGYFIGFVSSIVVKGEGGIILLKLLPHGIFELPAVFISLGLGFKLGTFVFQKNKWKSIKEYFWNSVRVFLFVVLPLLIIAAIIEGSLIFFGK